MSQFMNIQRIIRYSIREQVDYRYEREKLNDAYQGGD